MEVLLDRWDNAKIGASVPRFIERISSSQYIIVIGTRQYKIKYKNNEPMRSFVLAAEGDLIGKRMIGQERAKETILPVLLEATEEEAFPDLLHGRVYADFRDKNNYFDAALELILEIQRIDRKGSLGEELRDALHVQKAR